MGVAGAGAANHAVLVTGVAGLVAGACSMALGGMASVANAREFAGDTDRNGSRRAGADHPRPKQHELALILPGEGIAQADARRCRQIMQDKRGTLDTCGARNSGSTRRSSAAIPGARLQRLCSVLGWRDFPWYRSSGRRSLDTAPAPLASAAALCTVGMLTSLSPGGTMVLGGPPGDLRLPRSGADLWNRLRFGGFTVLTRFTPTYARDLLGEDRALGRCTEAITNRVRKAPGRVPRVLQRFAI